MRTVIHVGIAKAASTYIQDTVLPRLIEVALPFADGEGQRILGAIALDDQLKFDDQGIMQEVRRRMTAVASEKKIIAASSEGLTLLGGCDRRVRVQRLRRLFPDSDILFVIRRQDDLIRSFYGGAVNLGLNNFGMRRFPDINSWLELTPRFAPVRFVQNVHPLAAAAYHEILREYVDVFGRPHVHVLLFEEFVRDKAAFALAFASVLGQSENQVLDLLYDEPKRQVIVDGKVTHKVSFSPLQKQSNVLSNRFAQRAIREVVPRLRPTLRTDLNEKWMQRIAEAFSEGNRWIAREFDLPLAQYNYPGCGPAHPDREPS